MDKQFFVKQHSIVRRIWGRSDIVLFIFAGASAEFALNKAVDWLYFTGRLPADPIGRLFSTVVYARRIVFSPLDEANRAIASMRSIHNAVEAQRGAQIPAWAYRDVLFMLIYYSIAAFELLERRLTDEEKEDVYDVFYRVGRGMGVQDLPLTYADWLPVRASHLTHDLMRSHHTQDLFMQYKRQLGTMRYAVLIEAQKLVVPDTVKTLMQFSPIHWLAPSVPLYKLSKWLHLDWLVKTLLLPSEYKEQINALDVVQV